MSPQGVYKRREQMRGRYRASTSLIPQLRFYGNLGFKIRNEHDFVLPSGKVWDDHLMVFEKESKA